MIKELKEKRYLSVKRKYDGVEAIAQYSVYKETGEFVESEGVYLAQRTEKKNLYYPVTPLGRTTNVSIAIYHTLDEMFNDGWMG